MKRRSRFTILTLGATLIGALAAGYAMAQMDLAQPRHGIGPGMMMGPGGMMGGGQSGMQGMPGMMMGARSGNGHPWITLMLDRREDLGLSAEQVGRLFTLREDFAKEARKKSEKLEAVEGQLDQMLGAGPVDLRAVEAKLKEAEALRTDLRFSRIKVIEEGKKVLTPEQRTKFVELAKQSQESSRHPSQQHTMGTTGGMEEMHRFMQSERGRASMDAMMEMARRMGNGDTMLGMTRMMEMMGNMGGMMGTPGQAGPSK